MYSLEVLLSFSVKSIELSMSLSRISKKDSAYIEI